MSDKEILSIIKMESKRISQEYIKNDEKRLHSNTIDISLTIRQIQLEGAQMILWKLESIIKNNLDKEKKV